MSIRVSVNAGDVSKSVADRRLKGGVYQGRIISSRADVDKKTGNMRILTQIAPVDESGNTRRPNVILITKLPLPTSPETLAHFGLPATKEDGSPFQEAVPNTGWDIFNYVQATRPELAPELPKFDAMTKKWYDATTEATYKTKGEAGARKAELMKPAFDFMAQAYENLVNDPDAKDLLGDEFVFEVSYRPGSDFPNVKILGAECPADKVLVTDLSGATETIDG